MPEPQRTISTEVSLDGLGLFSGERSTLTITPGEPNTGILFIREQGGHVARIQALVQNVLKRPRRTCLRNGTLYVETIEHCMAALAGTGVTNAVIRIAGGITGELPAVDGSARPFVEALHAAGIVDQDAPVDPIIIEKPVQVASGEATLAALPGPRDHLEVIYDFEAPAPVGRQVFVFEHKGSAFVEQIASARTFVFEDEAQELRARGFGRHLTPQDLLVIAPSGPVENQWRFADECVRHKVLDIIGDLALAGRPIYGRIVAHKSGHEMNHLLVRKLLQHVEETQR
ncbi:MAG: UDP-3-O-acyl-N-acetylglucosamine deacetylase [Tepidisphaeraceae bacterium]|jgi:UDP-3-O-[3-hydroxymyristoyl] N-acetylglucosamine deacetylase/3-hydroxyacyl-[acyl-carrier-protein] dehydratase